MSRAESIDTGRNGEALLKESDILYTSLFYSFGNEYSLFSLNFLKRRCIGK